MKLLLSMGYPVVRVGMATLACAVLSGVEPTELQDAASVNDVVTIDDPDDIVSHVRRLSTNSTGGDISTGSWVAIIVGAASVVVLVIGALWWFMCRKPPMYTPGGPPAYARMKGAMPMPMSPYGEIQVNDARNLPPGYFHEEGASAADGVDMPLLRLPASGNGASRV